MKNREKTLKPLSVENNKVALALASHNMTQERYVQLEDEAEYLVKELTQTETTDDSEDGVEKRKLTDRRFPRLVGNQLDLMA